jgi:hypothetical protein
VRRPLIDSEPPRLAPIANKLIDSVFHPLGEQDPVFYIADTIAHHAVEAADQFVVSTWKTVRYNGPKLEELAKKKREV